MKTGPELPVAGMCSLAGVSRAGYYRARQPVPKPSQEDLKVRDAMHRVAMSISVPEMAGVGRSLSFRTDERGS